MTSFINSVSQRLSAHFNRTQEEPEPETELEEEEAAELESPRLDVGFPPGPTSDLEYFSNRIYSGLQVPMNGVPLGGMTQFMVGGSAVSAREFTDAQSDPLGVISRNNAQVPSAPRHFASEAQIELERRLIRDMADNVTTTQDGHKMNAKLNEFYKLMKEEVKTISEEFQDDPEAASCADGIMEQFEIMFKEAIKDV